MTVVMQKITATRDPAWGLPFTLLDSVLFLLEKEVLLFSFKPEVFKKKKKKTNPTFPFFHLNLIK